MPRTSDIYGELTFNKKTMRQKLSKETFEKLMATIQKGEALEESTAEEVAHAMKEWAIEKGATHFTHWFQPQRGGTAEKHDAFISTDEHGEIIETFSAKSLIQSEPDASSFPSGGIRSTFEARGYTAWDPTSPAFLIEGENSKTLVIPSVFLSWTGDVLDIKTPFLRSLRAIDHAAIKLQKLLGNRYARKIVVYGGPEQEYFIFSKELFETRPDLIICDRTLFGAPPAKGQQMEDHYFGSINKKVLKFMEDLDNELYRRAIPAKTRHNEVAPNQFEIAPLYEEANLAVDHNLQIMDIMKDVASKYDLVVVLHEKPLAGVNGSGKHLNWSIGDNTGSNYLEPSASPLKNINFLITLGALLLGVDKYSGILRATIADAGNDHRLGANEAPPAIMSVYFGDYLTNLIDQISGIGKLTEQKMAEINLGVKNIPKISRDYSDRNRTSPIAFTGNKFEFRALGSSQNCSEALSIINLMVAYGYEIIEKRIEAIKTKQDIKEKAILVLKEVFNGTTRIRFEGNNYSEEWAKEAEKRGLHNDKNTPKAIRHYLDKESIELFKKFHVLSEKELLAKVEIKLETYIKTKEIEYKTAVNIARTMILPALLRHITDTANAYNSLSSSKIASDHILKDLKKCEKIYADIRDKIDVLNKALETLEEIESTHDKAHYIADKCEEALNKLRHDVDSAETIVTDEYWPMAKYQELLLPV